MTGLHPYTHGVRNNGAFVLGSEARTLAEVLSAEGYATGGFIGAVVLAIVGFFVARRSLAAQSKYRVAWDKALLSMVLVGKVVRNITLLRFIRTLAIMVKAGIPLDEGIALAKDVAHSAAVTEASHMMQQSIRRGGALADRRP